MAEYRSNSDVSRDGGGEKKPAEEKRAEKVTSGNAEVRKPSWLERKLKSVAGKNGETLEGFFARSISDMICYGIGMIGDMISNTISVKITGETMRYSSSGRSPAGRVSYRKFYDEQDRYDEPLATKQHNYDDIVFDSRGDAEVVLERMNELLEHFDVCRVADLYDLAGLQCGYTENKWGWTDLRNAYVERTRNGYRINLPRATAL